MKSLVKKMQGKGANRGKHFAREASVHFRFKAVVWTSAREDGFVYVTDLLSGKPAPLTQVDFYAIEEVDHLWSICMFVFCIDNNSNQYMRMYETRAPEKCRHTQLIGSLNNKHQELINGVNSNDVIELAWVAATGPLTAEAAMRQLGKKPADWEKTREVK